MRVPLPCIDIIVRSLACTGFTGRVSLEKPRPLAEHYLDPRRLDEQIELVEKIQPIKGDFLEVGSGFGGLVTYLNTKHGEGCRAFGVEPSADAYTGTMECTRLLAAENDLPSRFVAGVGENIPFQSNQFDIVYSTSVLEHVNDPEEVIKESIRVLKPGGLLQFVVPNYGSWWEGHYGVFMLPHMPKWLFKLYVRLMGRDAGFVDTLKFIGQQDLRNIVSTLDQEVEIITWGEELFEHRLRSMDFSEWASLSRLKPWVELLHKFKLVELGIKFCRVFHWETPVVMTLRKR